MFEIIRVIPSEGNRAFRAKIKKIRPFPLKDEFYEMTVLYPKGVIENPEALAKRIVAEQGQWKKGKKTKHYKHNINGQQAMIYPEGEGPRKTPGPHRVRKRKKVTPEAPPQEDIPNPDNIES